MQVCDEAGRQRVRRATTEAWGGADSQAMSQLGNGAGTYVTRQTSDEVCM